ncbi:helix-turn-helix transcriptional regulator [Hydrogenophaga borbori]
MQAQPLSPASPVWIQGPRLRQRWAISNSTFYAKLRAGLIPAPEYPFGPAKPYWRMEVIEQFEASKKAAA